MPAPFAVGMAGKRAPATSVTLLLVRSREGALVVALAATAAFRIFLFSAAFPFFANVDEHMHVDMVLKYARGYLPRPGGDAYEPQMARYLGTWGSPEYHLREAERGTGEVLPPVWHRGPAALAARIESSERFLAGRVNLEAHQPPVYYALAGVALNLGRALGLQGARLLYAVRDLNVVLGFALVLASYLFLREIYPGDALVRLGVPALLAVFPQDVFYYVTRDVLSPLLVGVGFFLALRLARPPHGGVGAHAAAGLVVAAACLAKYTNLTLLGVCALCTLVALGRRPEARSPRADRIKWLLLWALIAFPVGVWLLRNALLFGDLTATAHKVELMGWSRRSLADYWNHPLFTPAGLLAFVRDLLPSFWRGELAWHRSNLASRGVDLFYTASSLALVALAALGLRRRPSPQRFAEGMGLVLVLSFVAVIAGLSPLFAYTEFSNPSVDRPFFTQGRLISGALVPFLLLYVRGIRVATARLPGRAGEVGAWVCVGAVVCTAVVSEVALTREVFLSPYNWFHLP